MSLITFKGNRYKSGLLSDNAKMNGTPTIEVKTTELHPNFETMVSSIGELPLGHEPVFAKYEGSYVVLLGKEKVLQGKQEGKLFIRGKLLSNPMLKRCL